MYDLRALNPVYKYLPYCARLEEKEDPANPRKKLIEVTYLKTYPAYPWRLDDGVDHRDDDPKFFIDLCADAGLVTWETKEQKEERLKREEEEEKWNIQ